MILAGLWFGPNKPECNRFMSSVFTNNLKKLYKGYLFCLNQCSDMIKVSGIVMYGTYV